MHGCPLRDAEGKVIPDRDSQDLPDSDMMIAKNSVIITFRSGDTLSVVYEPHSQSPCLQLQLDKV